MVVMTEPLGDRRVVMVTAGLGARDRGASLSPRRGRRWSLTFKLLHAATYTAARVDAPTEASMQGRVHGGCVDRSSGRPGRRRHRGDALLRLSSAPAPTT